MMPVTHGLLGSNLPPPVLDYVASVTVQPGQDITITISNTVANARIDFTVNGVIQSYQLLTVVSEYSTIGNVGTSILIEIYGAVLTASYKGLSNTTDVFTAIDIQQADSWTSGQSLVEDLTNLTSIIITPNTAAWSDARSMYKGCGLASVPLTDMSGVNNFRDVFSLSSVQSVPAWDTSNGIFFERAFSGATSLACLSQWNTQNIALPSNTTDMFLNTPSLTDPTASEQTAILAGSNYVNGSPCP